MYRIIKFGVVLGAALMLGVLIVTANSRSAFAVPKPEGDSDQISRTTPFQESRARYELHNGLKVYQVEQGRVLPKLKPTRADQDAMKWDGNHYLMVIGIYSPPTSIDKRMGQRESWIRNYQTSQYSSRVKHFFLVGKSGDRAVDEQLANENTKYQDMVIFDWKDNIDMLTTKFSYVLTECKNR
jgi:hypothetical protein